MWFLTQKAGDDGLIPLTKICRACQGVSRRLTTPITPHPALPSGNGSYVDGIIADENSIVFGVMVRGMSAGSGTLTVILNAAGSLTTITQGITVGAALTPVRTN